MFAIPQSPITMYTPYNTQHTLITTYTLLLHYRLCVGSPNNLINMLHTMFSCKVRKTIKLGFLIRPHSILNGTGGALLLNVDNA